MFDLAISTNIFSNPQFSHQVSNTKQQLYDSYHVTIQKITFIKNRRVTQKASTIQLWQSQSVIYTFRYNQPFYIFVFTLQFYLRYFGTKIDMMVCNFRLLSGFPWSKGIQPCPIKSNCTVGHLLIKSNSFWNACDISIKEQGNPPNLLCGPQ